MSDSMYVNHEIGDLKERVKELEEELQLVNAKIDIMNRYLFVKFGDFETFVMTVLKSEDAVEAVKDKQGK